jgi:colicin import membrane protein
MRTSVTISAVGHAAFLLWATISLSAVPYKSDMPKPIVLDANTDISDSSKITAGVKTAPPSPQPRPLAETLGERKAPDDPLAKVANKEVKAAVEAPPPMPEPKPAPAAAKSQAEPKRDLIADTIKKDQARKSEPKKAAAQPPAPKRDQPKFDPKRVEALLDKRTAQRVAAAGDVVNTVPTLGAPSQTAAQLSQSEIDALRARLAQLWTPPVGAANPDEIVVRVRILLKPNGTLEGGPMVLSSGKSPFFVAARDSAIRALFRGQPYDMLKPEHYEQWRDIEITFDPRDMLGG